MIFSGVGVALVTLFDDRGDVNASGTAEHAARLVELGVQAVVVAGSTGEAATLSPDERDLLLQAVRDEVDGAVPVITGTGAPSARQAAELTRRAHRHGADGVLALSPPGGGDLHRYYLEVAEAAAGLPVLAYHFPAASAPGIPVDVLADLPVDGVKDSTGDADRLLEELGGLRMPIYVGSSAILSLAGPMGCAGAILALANLEPEACVKAFAGDAEAQRALGPAHLNARRGGVRALKAAVAERFGTPAVTRVG